VAGAATSAINPMPARRRFIPEPPPLQGEGKVFEYV
jgi:hypothetical protein